MRKPKIGNFRLNNLDKPVVQLDVRDGTVKCREVVHLEIDGIVYVVDRADKLAMGLFIDVVDEGWETERWKEGIHREIEYLVQDLQKIGHLVDELNEEADKLWKEADKLSKDVESMEEFEGELIELSERVGSMQEYENELREEIDELWEEGLRLEIEYLVQDFQKLREEIEYLQELEEEKWQKSGVDELREEIEYLQELAEKKLQKGEEICEEVEILEQHLKEETEYLQRLEKEYSDLQGLEYEYSEELLEASPWKSGIIRLSHGSNEEKIAVEEFERRHKYRKNRHKPNII